MYMRIVRGQVQPGQLDEMSRRWQDGIGARLSSEPGFRHGYFAGDRATNTTLGVTVWDQKPDEESMTQRMNNFRSQIQDILAGPPTVEEYEVLNEV